MKRYLYIAFVALLMASCHTQRGGVRTAKHDPQKQLVERVMQVQPDFSTAKAGKVRFTINYAERTVAANGSINIVKDSAIVLSVQPMLGIELFRAELTPEAIVVVDKLNRRYVRTTFADLQKRTGMAIGFSDIQALCLSRLFVVGQQQSDLPNLPFSVSNEAEYYLLRHTETLLDYAYTIGKTDLLLQQTVVSPKGTDYKIQVRYMQPQITDDVLFPQVIEFVLDTPRLKGSCTISLLRLCFDCEVNTAPLPLDRYTPVTLSTLLSK